MSSAAAITNVNARFAFVLLIVFLLNHIMKDSQHNVDYVVRRSGISSLSHWDFENCIKKMDF